MKKIFDKISSPGESPIKSALKLVHFLLTKPGLFFLARKARRLFEKNEQAKLPDPGWVDQQVLISVNNIDVSNFTLTPFISILFFIDSEFSPAFETSIQNIINQAYKNWELLIYCNYEQAKPIQLYLDSTSKQSKIKLISGTDNHRPNIYNTLKATADGEYIVFLTPNSTIFANCLLCLVEHINRHPQNEIVYSDTIYDTKPGIQIYFKPDWSPDGIISKDYIGDSFLIKKTLSDKLGDLNSSYSNLFLYDLLLRTVENTTGIGHIPNVLFLGERFKTYHDEQKQIIEAALKRRGTPGEVVADSAAEGVFFVDYTITKPGKVSIIIPTKDNVQMLRTTIESIIDLTHYSDYEIIILNNNSTSKEFFDLVAKYENKKDLAFKCITASFPFNFSKLINLGVAESSGEYILMLNNDVEVLQADWLERMMGYAQLAHIGAVGVKLLFPDETIQHAGVVLGVGDGASHSFINFPKESDVYFNYLQSVNNCSAVTAACLMVRRDVYNEVGGMDEALPVEFNDVDFCLKLRKAGYYNVYIPSVELYHYESATRGHPFRSHAAWKQHEDDMNYFKNKWGAVIDNDPFYNPNLTTEHTDFRQKRRTKA